MQRFIAAFEANLKEIVRVGLLVALSTGLALYFGDGQFTPLGVLTAFCVESFTYLAVRGVVEALDRKRNAALGSDEETKATEDLRNNLIALGVALAFDFFCQFMFNASSWNPPTSAYSPPPLVSIILKSLIVPLFMVATAFLAGVKDEISAMIEATSHSVVRAGMRGVKRQSLQRIKEMEKNGEPLAPVIVALMDKGKGQEKMTTLFTALYPSQPQEVAPVPFASSARGSTADRIAPDRLTKTGKAILAYLDQHPGENIPSIMEAVGCERAAASKWRGIWESENLIKLPSDRKRA